MLYEESNVLDSHEFDLPLTSDNMKFPPSDSLALSLTNGEDFACTDMKDSEEYINEFQNRKNRVLVLIATALGIIGIVGTVALVDAQNNEASLTDNFNCLGPSAASTDTVDRSVLTFSPVPAPEVRQSGGTTNETESTTTTPRPLAAPNATNTNTSSATMSNATNRSSAPIASSALTTTTPANTPKPNLTEPGKTEPAPATPTPKPSTLKPTKPSTVTSGDLKAQVVRQTSIIRASHGLGPVTWDDELGVKMQVWADSCPQKTGGGHGGPPGNQNLASFIPCGNDCMGQKDSPAWNWYVTEESLFDYDTQMSRDGNWMTTGHFTNSMAPDVNKIACGWSTCYNPLIKKDDSLIWCNYFSTSPGEGGKDIPRPKQKKELTYQQIVAS